MAIFSMFKKKEKEDDSSFVLTLTQQSISGQAEDLSSSQKWMCTGSMGCCVCVIVLFNKVNEIYQDVRGFHGGGGIAAVNFASLFQGVPNNNTTQVYVISGPENMSEYNKKWVRNTVADEMATTIPQAFVRFHHGIANAKVDRHGEVKILSFERY